MVQFAAIPEEGGEDEEDGFQWAAGRGDGADERQRERESNIDGVYPFDR